MVAAAIGLATLTASMLPLSAEAQPGGQARWQQWPRQPFPDGSGSVAVPPSWRVTSVQRGSVEMQSAGGDAFAGGVTFAVGPAQFGQPGVLAGPYLPPAQAFAWVQQVIGQRGNYQNQVVRVLEVQPTAPMTQNGQSAFVLADMLIRGRPYRTFSLVNTANLGNGYWQYYMTMTLSPVERFGFALPVILDVWRSWSVSQAEMNRRLSEGLQTMRQTNEIMRNTSAILTRGPTAVQQEITGDLFRGEWVIEDYQERKRWKVTNEQANRLFEAHPGRYRMVPADER